jgi:serine/threonine-protein kinase
MDALLRDLQLALEGRYRLERELGHGGMATVYLAWDAKHDRKVALKVLRPEVAASFGPDRFLREIQIAARLSHPHILPLHDSGRAGPCVYYVMPFVPGESLRARIHREQQLPIEDALRIAAEVAGALGYATAMTSCTATSSRKTSCSRAGTPWWWTSASGGRSPRQKARTSRSRA